jgi:COMPASS component SWD3
MRPARDAIAAENKQLKKRLEAAERENLELKRSLYELSTRLSVVLARQTSRSPGPARPSAPAPDADTGASLATDDPQAMAAAMAGAMAGQEVRGGASPASRGAHLKRSNGGGPGGGDGGRLGVALDLKGHTGAVYAVRYSPSGRLLASGSFDHTIRLWSRGEEMACLREHSHNVSDVCWSPDSLHLFSGSFDHTVRLWDVSRSESVSAFEVGRAFVLSLALQTNDVVWAATSAGGLLQFDRRTKNDRPAQALRNDCMLHSVAAAGEAIIMSGDKRGMLKAWDVRTGSCVGQRAVGSPARPISHVEISPEIAWRGAHASRLRLLSTNSYDDTLRVFAEEEAPPGIGAAGGAPAGIGSTCGGATPGIGGAGGGAPPGIPEAEVPPRGWRPLCELQGHKNQAWPVRSSFAAGDGWARLLGDEEDGPPRWQTHGTALVATGSTDGRAHVYAVFNSAAGVASELVQTLDGHTDRVYATSFHPTEHQLATGSADFMVKVWAA